MRGVLSLLVAAAALSLYVPGASNWQAGAAEGGLDEGDYGVGTDAEPGSA